MMFQGESFTGENPFKDCYMHGLIRAKDGRKMSKSLGNGVEPIDMVEKYGADSLRYYLTTSSAPGLDLRFDEEKLTSTWNFINKIWNASRFTLMNIEDIKELDLSNLTFSDKWILTKFNNTVKQVRKNMEKYEFQNVGAELYDFIWSDFCDGYIEFSKFNSDNIGTKSTLLYVLTGILKMLHPFMPFVTEEIYQMLPIKDAESIMISSYPKYDKKLDYKDTIDLMDSVREFITKVRTFKKDNNISKDCKFIFKCSGDEEIESLISYILKLDVNNIVSKEEISSLEKLALDYNNSNFKANIEFYYKISEEDREKEIEALTKQKEVLESQIARREKLLSNPGYVNNAPKELVEEEKSKLKQEKEELEIVLGKLK